MAKIGLSILGLTLVCSTFGFSQNPPKNIYPLLTTRSFVTSSLGMGKNEGANRVSYEISDQKINVTYYDGGCSSPEEKQMNISKDTVIEVRITPDTPLPLADVIAKWAAFDHFNHPDKRTLYYDSNDGILVLASKNDRLEYVNDIYFVIPTVRGTQLSCIEDSLDADSGVALLSYFGVRTAKDDRFNFPPIDSGMYFESDQRSLKDNIIKSFSDELIKHPNRFGLIILFQKVGESSSHLSSRRRLLLLTLKRRGIGCDRVIFSNTGIGKEDGASFKVIHRLFAQDLNLRPACTFL